MDLIQQLVQQLGIREDQAEGGLGALLKLARENLADGEWSKLLELIPKAQELLSAAPDSSGGMMGALSGLATSLGGKTESLGQLAELAGSFEKLGLDASMIQKFASTALGFIRDQGGDSVADSLENLLK
jgi:hypothetical protein